MTRDMKILLGILLGIAVLVGVFIYMASPAKEVGTYWIEKGDGGGPYQLKTGSRSEEERRKHLEHVIRLDGEFEAPENPSDTPVHFSTGPGVGVAPQGSPNQIPEVNY